jgi:hypothetical protein
VPGRGGERERIGGALRDREGDGGAAVREQREELLARHELRLAAGQADVAVGAEERGPDGDEVAACRVQLEADLGPSLLVRRLSLRLEHADRVFGRGLPRALLGRQQPGTDLAALLQGIDQDAGPRLLRTPQGFLLVSPGHGEGEQSVDTASSCCSKKRCRADSSPAMWPRQPSLRATASP